MPSKNKCLRLARLMGQPLYSYVWCVVMRPLVMIHALCVLDCGDTVLLNTLYINKCADI